MPAQLPVFICRLPACMRYDAVILLTGGARSIGVEERQAHIIVILNSLLKAVLLEKNNTKVFLHTRMENLPFSAPMLYSS